MAAGPGPVAGARAASLVDLHAHSTASDGLLAPARLVALAAERGLRILALTDHDTVAGLAEAAAVARARGPRLVPGVELSTQVEAGEVHILGYFINPGAPDLLGALARFQDARAGRAATMVERLAAVGAPIALARVVALAGGGSLGRPHVARALVEAGHAASVGDAFERYLVRGRPGYVERYRLTPADAVRLVRAAGGVPVLAHPHSAADLDALLPELVAAGLGGLECHYGDYDDRRKEELLALAARHDLVATGGTDFHGLGLAHQRSLGDTPVPLECVAALEARR
jgi:predicted metal-dependent phosphoesterase TrpH